VDQLQIEQILMNLAANARHAMPQGGHLRIETSDVTLDDDYVHCKKAVIPTGRYALITVTDDGAGIFPEHLPHIFEPFYTTKPLGKGTGLGLATVYGIVKQNKGFVWAYSEPSMGTVFKIYLPCVARRDKGEEVEDIKSGGVSRGSETVLLIEDEQAVRRATAEFLRLQGYTVLEAKDGLDALTVARSYPSTIHLVVSDVVMPNMRRAVGDRTCARAAGYQTPVRVRLCGKNRARPQSGRRRNEFPAETLHVETAFPQGALRPRSRRQPVGA
jgi:CheY-like chemotaxis protein